jgi:phage head maturation protease
MLLTRGMALMTPVPLLLNHTGDPIGRVSYFRVLDGQKLYCVASIHSDEVWEQIKTYKLRALSIGYTSDHHEIKLDEERGVVRVIDRSRIREVSVVATPRDPGCYLRVFSGDAYEGRVEGQRSLSEIHKIYKRAKALVARLDKQYPRKIETVAKIKSSEWMTAAEKRRFDNWYRKSR